MPWAILLILPALTSLESDIFIAASEPSKRKSAGKNNFPAGILVINVSMFCRALMLQIYEKR